MASVVCEMSTFALLSAYRADTRPPAINFFLDFQ